MREPTDAERAYFQKTQAELAAALPAAPPDFKRTDTPPDFRAAPRMPVQCRDQKVGLFDIGVIGDDLYTHPRTPGDPEAGTVRSGDVRITVNMRQPPPSGSKPKGDDGAWGTPTATRNADPKVHNLAFGVNGPEGPARKALLDLVDTAWLQALVGRPLPEVGASGAQAGRQAERATAAAAAAPAAAPAATPAAKPAATPAAPAAAPAAGPAPSGAPVASPSPPAPSTPAPAPVAASPSATAPAPAPPPNCPPRADTGGQAANAGATIGGALLGGGWGRNVGSMIGGAVGAVAGSAPPGCPN